MKIVATLGDGEGSSYFRVRLPVETAQNAGVDVSCMKEVPVRERIITAPDGTQLHEVIELRFDADVLVVQRPITQLLAAICMQAKRQGMGLVVEVDDHFGMLHRDSFARANMTQTQNPVWLHAACQAADVVTVTTPTLAGEYGYGKAVIIPNYLPARIADYRHDGLNRGRIGWSGSTFTHHGDLPEARGVFAGNHRTLNVVGYEDGVAADLNISPDRVTATSWVHGIDNYWMALASNIDLGIVPLHGGTFNSAKSSLTLVTFASLGIPAVVSPTDPYKRLHAHGVGVLAKGPSQWNREVSRLLDDEGHWGRVRQRGLDWASVNHIEDHVAEWVSAWEAALDA